MTLELANVRAIQSNHMHSLKSVLYVSRTNVNEIVIKPKIVSASVKQQMIMNTHPLRPLQVACIQQNTV